MSNIFEDLGLVYLAEWHKLGVRMALGGSDLKNTKSANTPGSTQIVGLSFVTKNCLSVAEDIRPA
jgi:hypothetical protein